MTRTGLRLDGWKAIAGYFKRERSTVMRWARERDLPIHRMPGGKQGSVFAFEHELAEWALGHDTDAPEPVAEPPVKASDPPSIPSRTPPRRRPLVAVVVLIAIVALIGTLVVWRARDRPAPAMPHDPAAAADFVAARDHWARRTPDDLARAIQLFQGVVRRQPDFAPAHAGLAEAWLIYREYGRVGDAEAYTRARLAADQALRLDPDLPSARRASGFIAYWWDNDVARATAEFERATALDDSDAQTHFWYANVLSDLGKDALAQRQYARARLLSPGSRPIEVEQACSHWQAGRDAQALAALDDLARRFPDDATVHNCLAWVHISRGDIVAFGKSYRDGAMVRREPQLMRTSAALDTAIAREPATAHRILIDNARRELAEGSRRVRETPAFQASAMGDRATLIALLTEARELNEQWNSAAVCTRIARRWPGDAAITALLAPICPSLAQAPSPATR